MATFVAKPVIVFVHGAWHTPMHYSLLLAPLRAAGFAVEAPVNPSVATHWNGDTEALKGRNHHDDVANIRATLQPHLAAGREIVLVMHSYGGICGTDAVEGNTVEERREKGLQGGIRAVVYIASFGAPQRGVNIYTYNGGGPEPWLNVYVRIKNSPSHATGSLTRIFSQPSLEEGYYGFPNEKGARVFYTGVDETQAASAISSLRPQALDSFRTPCAYSAPEIRAPKWYVACEADEAIPFKGQQAFAEAMGAKMTVLKCGHSPFLIPGEIDGLVSIVKEAAGC